MHSGDFPEAFQLGDLAGTPKWGTRDNIDRNSLDARRRCYRSRYVDKREMFWDDDNAPVIRSNGEWTRKYVSSRMQAKVHLEFAGSFVTRHARTVREVVMHLINCRRMQISFIDEKIR